MCAKEENGKERMTATFTMRLPLGLMEAIREDIENSDDFNSVSQWMNSACREYLAKRRQDRAIYMQVRQGNKEL